MWLSFSSRGGSDLGVAENIDHVYRLWDILETSINLERSARVRRREVRREGLWHLGDLLAQDLRDTFFNLETA